MHRRSWLLFAVLALSVLAAGCDRAAPGAMVPIVPPVRWQASLAAERGAKDEAFRLSPETPLLAEDVPGFAGLEYWPPDPALYFAGPIRLFEHPEPFQIVTTAGKFRPCEKFGWIEFPVGGGMQRLEVYRLLDVEAGAGAESLLLPFTDGTTGQETYPSGRYVDLQGPPGEVRVAAGPDRRPLAVGPYVLDFNQAYNPSCAYGAPERFACPVTPKANQLSVRIEAGERGFKPGTEARGG